MGLVHRAREDLRKLEGLRERRESLRGSWRLHFGGGPCGDYATSPEPVGGAATALEQTEENICMYLPK